ncbi:MAG TPA: 2-succinyl-6-hydroxy-2,4-cyclohexadiene-1-carboxylate synthase [Myxococcales bacterium]|nr:2-succinyl-6-hydroxy-2,4-cyclohexadiene-1-carboxylate synthase [Myxococcales bacterium]HIK84895.1 2-succinyl-6-hydroxy-2,4-cyclohexadiene-1-carboxylate synthase [Myxococcales bacterium]
MTRREHGMFRDGEVFIDACGVRLRAVVDGSALGDDAEDVAGDTVLVLHGFTGAAESMETVRAALCNQYRVVRLELIGHGGSASPAESDSYAMKSCAEQIVEVVRKLALRRPHLVGYSMGGRAAIAAAVAAPECFSSLVLIGATAGIADPALRKERFAADCALADRIESAPLSEFVDSWMALPIFASQSSLGAQALEGARVQRMANEKIGLANSLRGMGAGAQQPFFDQLGSIAVPVLLVVGEADAKFRGIATLLAADLPDARIAVVPGVGHAAHLEASDAFGKRISGFLAEVAATAKKPTTSPSEVISPDRSDRG